MKIKLFCLLFLGLIVVGTTSNLFAGAINTCKHIGPRIYPLIFPVSGSSSYIDTFGAARDGGSRSHKGADIFGKKGQALLAAAPGKIADIGKGSRSGYFLKLKDKEGNIYFYVHLNNDRPGTDDGKGGTTTAYVKGIKEGVSVLAGQKIAYMGDSGNAESSKPHLHYEIWPNGSYSSVICPNHSLDNALRISKPTSSFNFSKPISVSISPNPFSPDKNGYTDLTNFNFKLTRSAFVTIKIFNSSKEVARPVLNKYLAANIKHRVRFNGVSLTKTVLTNGTYSYEIIAKAGSGLTASTLGKLVIKHGMLPPGTVIPKITNLTMVPTSSLSREDLSQGIFPTLSFSLSQNAIITASFENSQELFVKKLTSGYWTAGAKNIPIKPIINGEPFVQGNYSIKIFAKNTKDTSSTSFSFEIK